ncbi:MAG: hypothetical protein J2P57_00455 [Acidimicrobiaceae bacterium]|nr:hypothetical protein [Acidimicrobiaceae bacterium]
MNALQRIDVPHRVPGQRRTAAEALNGGRAEPATVWAPDPRRRSEVGVVTAR